MPVWVYRVLISCIHKQRRAHQNAEACRKPQQGWAECACSCVCLRGCMCRIWCIQMCVCVRERRVLCAQGRACVCSCIRSIKTARWRCTSKQQTEAQQLPRILQKLAFFFFLPPSLPDPKPSPSLLTFACTAQRLKNSGAAEKPGGAQTTTSGPRRSPRQRRRLDRLSVPQPADKMAPGRRGEAAAAAGTTGPLSVKGFQRRRAFNRVRDTATRRRMYGGKAAWPAA